MKVERVVLDTNVLISAALSSVGNPFACLSWVLDNAALIASKPLLDELDTRLARPKFKRYLNDARRRSFIADLALSCEQVESLGLISICRDPDDDKVLEAAVVGGADCIVTGDQDLIVLSPFRAILIVTPTEFLQAIA